MASSNKNTQRDVNVKVNAEVREALRNLSQLERQVNKLGDLADQGERQQRGFLSPKQVTMYRKILNEIERAYGKHYKNVTEMGEEFQKKQQKAMEDLAKRQQNLNRAQGGNKWGDVASPRIVDYHERKLKESQSYVDSLTPLKAELDRMTELVRKMGGERDRGQGHAERINNLHEMDPYTKHQIQSAVNVASTTGIISSIGALVNYLGVGKDLIRDREAGVRNVVQGGAYEGSDETNIKKIEDVGIRNGYNSADTTLLQSMLNQGGTRDQDKSLQDVQTGQQFGRAFGIDQDALVPGYNMLRQMGTMDEGEMKRFADLLAGAIAANGMDGRQEEMIRSTTLLAHSVSQGLVEMSKGQLNNIVSLQAALGSASPELRGERGASMLSNLDQGIKGADHNLELLLGKGTEFTGIEGYYQLQLLKEEGLSNPENFQRILQNTEKGLGTREMRNLALRQFGLSLHQIEEMEKTGMLDQIRDGTLKFDESMLESLGTEKLAEQDSSYRESETATRQSNDAQQEQRQRNVADEWEAVGSWIMDKFNNLPDWVQKAGIFGGAVGGGLLGGKLVRGAGRALMGGYKKVSPTIGEKNAPKTILDRLFNRKPPTPPATPGTPPATPGTPTGPRTILGPDGKPLAPSSSVPEPPTKPASKLSKLGKWGGKLGGKKVSALLGIASGAATIASMPDMFESASDLFSGGLSNEMHSEGRPLAQEELQARFPKGLPSYLQAYVDAGHRVTNDMLDMSHPNYYRKWNGYYQTEEGQREAALFNTNPGQRKRYYYNGEGAEPNPISQDQVSAIADWASNVHPLAKASNYETPGLMTPQQTISKMAETKQPTWVKEFSDVFKGWERLLDKKNNITQEHTVRVIIDGKIDGMDPNNQAQVKDSMMEFFKNGIYNPFANFNLMMDQKRGK